MLGCFQSAPATCRNQAAKWCASMPLEAPVPKPQSNRSLIPQRSSASSHHSRSPMRVPAAEVRETQAVALESREQGDAGPNRFRLARGCSRRHWLPVLEPTHPSTQDSADGHLEILVKVYPDGLMAQHLATWQKRLPAKAARCRAHRVTLKAKAGLVFLCPSRFPASPPSRGLWIPF